MRQINTNFDEKDNSRQAEEIETAYQWLVIAETELEDKMIDLLSTSDL